MAVRNTRLDLIRRKLNLAGPVKNKVVSASRRRRPKDAAEKLMGLSREQQNDQR